MPDPRYWSSGPVRPSAVINLNSRKPSESSPDFTDWQEKADRAHGLAEVIIGKQRHGPTGTVELSFQAEFTRFGNLAQNARLPDRIE